MPENVMMGKDNRLRLGHFHSAICFQQDPPRDRIALLDYTPPEVLAMAVDEDDPALHFLNRQATQALPSRSVSIRGQALDSPSAAQPPSPGRQPLIARAPSSAPPASMPPRQRASARSLLEAGPRLS
jgi:hypothetical protein